jgi:hypothetical protein
VPFGRIINNTIIGLGGRLGISELYNAEDFEDSGILIEDNADPTLLNNVIVNFHAGLAVDNTSAGTTVGGTLFQGNADNTRNINIGDFALEVDDAVQLFVDLKRGNFYPSDQSPLIDSGIDSLPDRSELVTVKQPLGISASPLLAPAFDQLGQLRIDDPRVEPPGGVGQNVFVDRGAIDRVDFLGPAVGLVTPLDNDTDGQDSNPSPDQVRLRTGVTLTEFVIQFSDLGETGTLTGAGIDDRVVSSDSLVILRDGVPLVPGVDYRFDYQPTTDQIRLTPQAGVWLSGFRYQIILANEDQFVVAVPDGSQIPDGESFEVAIADPSSPTGQRSTVFEFESGFTIQLPEPLTIEVQQGTSGLSEITDGDLFTINDGLRLVTFEFDTDGIVPAGRVRIPFSPSDTPARVADLIVSAVTDAQFGLTPKNLGGGRVHIGGPASIRLDTSLSSLVQTGAAGAMADGEVVAVAHQGRTVTFEFDRNDRRSPGNTGVPFNDNMTRSQLADALVTAISATSLGLAPKNVGGGRAHLGGNATTSVRQTTGSLVIQGQPGANTPGTQSVLIPYEPSAETNAEEIATAMAQAVLSSTLTGLIAYVDDVDRLVVRGAQSVVATNSTFISAFRDLAGNRLSTNQDVFPFDVRFEIDLPAPMDFGDAPDPGFSTLLSSNGARHVVLANIFLGSAVNEEDDGKPSDDAAGDAGDDGIVFLSQAISGGRIPVLAAASANGFLDAWVDFNQDKVFDPVEERIFDSQQVVGGLNPLRFKIPDDVTLGSTYARFRYSTIGNLGPGGRADNGEVEDYLIEIIDIEPPVSQADAYTTSEDTELTIDAAAGLLANDSDPQDDELSALLVDNVSHGTLTLNGDGSFTYVPEGDFSGEDSFTYLATDDVQDSQTVTVTLVVEPGPDPPLAADDSATTDEDTLTVINLIVNDNDPDGALVNSSVKIVGQPSSGTVTVDENGSASYTPNENFFGTDTFTYTVDDAEGATSNEATVTITVTDINDAPQTVNDQLSTRRNTPATIDVLNNDLDVDGELVRTSLIITLSPKSGRVVINGDGTVTFTPLTGFEGTDTFRYTVRDDDGATSNVGSVTVNVTSDNEPPVAEDDSAQTDVESAVTINVLENDSDPDGQLVPQSVTIVQDPANGTATVDEEGNIVYTPNAGFQGSDTLQYTVRDDDNVESNMAVVTINVNPLAPPWQNPSDRLDVNNDGFVVPLDALQVINEINARGPRELGPPPLPTPPFNPPPYLDVNGDGFLAPLDALLIINFLNDQSAPEAPVNAVAAVETHQQIVAAALSIEPRRRAGNKDVAAVDRAYGDQDLSRAALLRQDPRNESVFRRLPTEPGSLFDESFDEDVLHALAADIDDLNRQRSI